MSDDDPRDEAVAADPDTGDSPATGEAGDDLHKLLRRVERLVDPRSAMRAAQGPAEAAWRGVTSEEPRMQVTIAVVAAIGLAAQDIFAGAQRAAVRNERPRHPYVLSGLMRSSQCGRKMQASWNNGRAYYRCKFPAEYAITEEQHPKTVYVQEQAIVPSLDQWIGSLFANEHVDATCEALAAVGSVEPEGRRGDANSTCDGASRNATPSSTATALSSR